MLIKNCKLREKDNLCDILIEDGRFKTIAPNGSLDYPGQNVIDANGNLLIPPFVEPHIHLDCVLTAGEPRYNQSGTLFEGIEIWAERKRLIPTTKEQIKRNAIEAIKLQIGYGVQAIRTHVDVTDESLLALEALVEIKQELRDIVEIQIVAFPQEGLLSFPNGTLLMEEALKRGADVVGGIPHYEFTRQHGVDSMKKVTELACKYDKLVDVHCDETDDDQSRFLEVLASCAYESGLGSRVTASHTTAMHSYNNAYCYKLFNVLKLSGINFASCPTESTHLQGRLDTFPKRRGVTRVKELSENGMNVAFGQDSIADPWYPMGTGNLLRVLDMGLHVCQIMGHDEICKSLDFITVNGAKNLSILDHYGIEEGKPANFVILNAKDEFSVIRFLSEVLYSVRNGNIIMKKTPSKTEVIM